MLPFCGYNMGDYFQHWLDIEKLSSDPSKLPKIFFVRIFSEFSINNIFSKVNWFRKGDHHEYLWPGFSDNVRVLKWIFERCHGNQNYTETPIGKNFPPFL